MIPFKIRIDEKPWILTFLIAIVFIGYSQKPKTYYVNSEGKRTPKAFAKFNREIIKMDDKFLVKDFYLNGTLQMEGSYKDKSLKQKTGTFTYYYLNGKPSSILNYKNGKKYGIAKWYTISGKLYKSLNYLMGDLEVDEELYNSEPSIVSEQQKSETITDLETDRPLNYKGGQKAIAAYFKTLDYPFEAYRDDLYGQIHAVVEIDETGTVGDVDIIIHGSPKIDSTIISNIQKMSAWIPAIKNGRTVSSRFAFAIRLTLGTDRASVSDAILAKGFFKSGVSDYKNGKYDKATFKFNKATLLKPMEAKYQYYLGHGYYKTGNKQFACEYWNIAHRLDNQILKKEVKRLCGIK